MVYMVILNQEPLTIVAGDSVTWLRSLPDYSAAEGWVLHYVLLSQGKPPITFESTAQGAAHLIALTAMVTKDWPAAEYCRTAYVTKDTERKSLSSGLVAVLPDPTTLDESHDPRTENQKILQAITLVLAGELTNPLAEYKIGGREGREIKRHSRMELLKLQSIYTQRVAVEMGQTPFIGSIPIRFTEDHGIPGGGYV